MGAAKSPETTRLTAAKGQPWVGAVGRTTCDSARRAETATSGTGLIGRSAAIDCSAVQVVRRAWSSSPASIVRDHLAAAEHSLGFPLPPASAGISSRTTHTYRRYSLRTRQGHLVAHDSGRGDLRALGTCDWSPRAMWHTCAKWFASATRTAGSGSTKLLRSVRPDWPRILPSPPGIRDVTFPTVASFTGPVLACLRTSDTLTGC